MYQPTTVDDLNTWPWLGDGSGLGPPPPQAPLVVHPVSEGQEQDAQTQGLHGSVNGNGLHDPVSYYDTYQYHSYNYGAPTEAQYVGTLFHADPTAPSGSGNATSVVPIPMPIIPNGDGGEDDRGSPSIFDLSTHVVPPSEVDLDAGSLLDISSVSGTSSIMNMDLSSHIATSLHQGTEGGQETMHEHETYNSYANAGQGPGFSQCQDDTELRIKTEDMYSHPHAHADGFIPTAPIQRGSNGCIFARKSKPSTSNGNGFSMDVDEFDEYEDEESQESYDSYDLEADPGSLGRMSREQRRLQRMDANTRAVQIQNQRNAQHPNARKCEICGNLFRGKLVLRRHQIVIHKLRLPNWEQVLAAEERNNAKVPCDLCGKEVARRSMNIHLSQVHRGGRVAVPHKGKFKRGVGRNLGRPRKAVPFLEPQAAPRRSSTSTTNGNRGAPVDYSYLLRQEYQPFVPVERFTNIAKAVARYEEYVAARITKKRRSSSFDSAAWKKNLPPAMCNLCGNVFRHKYTLRVHQAKVHKMPVPRLYTKRTPTPSPVKISGQAHAPPPPASAVRALFRSSSTPAAYAEPPKLELESHDEDYGSNSPSMPHLTPVTGDSPAPTPSTSGSMSHNLPRRRPMPASRRLALASASAAAPGGARASTRVVVAGDKANANAANRVLIRYSKSLDDLQSPHLQPRPHQRPWLHEGNHVQLHESTLTTMVQKRPRGKNKNLPRQVEPKSEVSEVKKRRRRRRRHQRWSRSLPLHRRQQGHQHASNIGASVRTRTTDSITSSRNNSYYNVKPTAKQLREIQQRQIVIKVWPSNIPITVRQYPVIVNQNCRGEPARYKPLKTQVGYKCQLCLRVLAAIRNLREHLVNVHRQPVQWVNWVTRKHCSGKKSHKKFICKICARRLSPRHMYTHLRETHGVKQEFYRHFSRAPATINPILKFQPVSEEKKHAEKVEVRLRPVQVAPLPKLSSEHHERRKRLIAKVHQRKRANIRRFASTQRGPWVCSICQRVMSKKWCLDEHQILIHGLKPSGMDYRAVLIRTQKARRRVQCKICGHKCNRSNFSAHFSLKHGRNSNGMRRKHGSLIQYFTEIVQKSSTRSTSTADEDDDDQLGSEAEGGLQETLSPSTTSESPPEESKLRCKVCRMVLPQSAMLMHLKVTHQHRYMNPSLVVNYSIPVPAPISSKVTLTRKDKSAELSDWEPPEVKQEQAQELEIRTRTRPGQVSLHPVSPPKCSARRKRLIASVRHRQDVKIRQAVKGRLTGQGGTRTCSICQRVMVNTWQLRRHELGVHGLKLPGVDYQGVVAHLKMTKARAAVFWNTRVECKLCRRTLVKGQFRRHFKCMHKDKIAPSGTLPKAMDKYFTELPFPPAVHKQEVVTKKLKTKALERDDNGTRKQVMTNEELPESESPEHPEMKQEQTQELEIRARPGQVTSLPTSTHNHYSESRKRLIAGVRRRQRIGMAPGAHRRLKGLDSSKTCSICQRVMHSHWARRRHEIGVHGLKLPGVDYTSAVSDLKKTKTSQKAEKVQCKICGRVQTKMHFCRHLKTVHKHHVFVNPNKRNISKTYFTELSTPQHVVTAAEAEDSEPTGQEELPESEYSEPESPDPPKQKPEPMKELRIKLCRVQIPATSRPKLMAPDYIERRKRHTANVSQRRRVKNKFMRPAKHQISGPKASRTCHICHRVLADSWSLRRHHLVIHRAKVPGFHYDSIMASLSAQAGWNKRVQCKLCGHLRGKKDFSRHLRLMHKIVNTDETQLKQYFIEPPSPQPAEPTDLEYREPESLELLELKQEEPPTHEVKRPVTVSTPSKLSPELRERRKRLIANVLRRQHTKSRGIDNTTTGPWNCPICHRVMSGRWSFLRHQLLLHGFRVPNVDYSKVLSEIKNAEKRVRCKICDLICLQQNYHKHFCRKHKDENVNDKSYKQHYMVIPGDEPASSSPSSPVTCTKSELEHPDSPASLTNFGSPMSAATEDSQCSTTSSSIFTSASTSSSSLQCKICLKEFRQSGNLRDHQVFVHKLPIPGHERISKTRRHSVRCNFCSTIFSRSAVYLHLKIMHGVRGEFPQHFTVLSPKSKGRERARVNSVNKSSEQHAQDQLKTEAYSECQDSDPDYIPDSPATFMSRSSSQACTDEMEVDSDNDQGSPELPASTSEPASYQCAKCPKVFSSSYALAGHQGAHSVVRPKSDSPPIRNTDILSCRICSKVAKFGVMLGHLKRFHSKKIGFSRFYHLASSEQVVEFQRQKDMESQLKSPPTNWSASVTCLVCRKTFKRSSIKGHLQKLHAKRHGLERFFKIVAEDQQQTTAIASHPNPDPGETAAPDDENAANEDHQQAEIVRCNICEEVMPRATVGRHLIAEHGQRHGFWRFFEVIDETEDGEQAEQEETDGESQPTPTEVRRQSRRIPIVKKKHALKRKLSESSSSSSSMRGRKRARLNEIEAEDGARKPEPVAGPSGTCKQSLSKSSNKLRRGKQKRGHWLQKVQEKAKAAKEFSRLCLEMMTRKLVIKVHRVKVPPKTSVTPAPASTTEAVDPPGAGPSSTLPLVVEADEDFQSPVLEPLIGLTLDLTSNSNHEPDPDEPSILTATATDTEVQPVPEDPDDSEERENGNPIPSTTDFEENSLLPPVVVAQPEAEPNPSSSSTQSAATQSAGPVPEPNERPSKKKFKKLYVDVEDCGLRLGICRVCDEPIPFATFTAHQALHSIECHLCGQNVIHTEVAEHGVTHVSSLKCEVCGQTFKQAMTLWEHMNRHLHVEPLLCIWCGTRFASQATRRTHILIQHTNIAPFQCALCDRKFTTRSSKRTHEARHCGSGDPDAGGNNGGGSRRRGGRRGRGRGRGGRGRGRVGGGGTNANTANNDNDNDNNNPIDINIDSIEQIEAIPNQGLQGTLTPEAPDDNPDPIPIPLTPTLDIDMN